MGCPSPDGHYPPIYPSRANPKERDEHVEVEARAVPELERFTASPAKRVNGKCNSFRRSNTNTGCRPTPCACNNATAQRHSFFSRGSLVPPMVEDAQSGTAAFDGKARKKESVETNWFQKEH